MRDLKFIITKTGDHEYQPVQIRVSTRCILNHPMIMPYPSITSAMSLT